MTEISDESGSNHQYHPWQTWVTAILLILILIAGAYLRLVGIDWDEEQHLHPDERFLTMVEATIEPIGQGKDFLGPPPSVSNQPWREPYVDSLPDCEEWGGYFNTACSPLNPNNRGYDFYVYGTLPIFIVRYAAEFLGKMGYGEVYLVGRVLSAFSDLLAALLVFAVAKMVYGRRIALMATAFSAFSVLLIQQSHFFTVDTFTNLFIMSALYFAVRIAFTGLDKEKHKQQHNPRSEEATIRIQQPERSDGSNLRLGYRSLREIIRRFINHPLFWPSIWFGATLGMAVSSKINAAVLAVTLPGAAFIYLYRIPQSDRGRQIWQVFSCLVLAALVSVVAFRIFQPYAFRGPSFFDITPNKAWLDDLRSLRAQTGGDVDFPPALQWARRPIWFSFQNLVVWGLGLPLGILSWIGYFWMGWKIFRGKWMEHGLLWAWTGLYFGWQSLQWNSTMRYQLPIYPLLAIFAAWIIVQFWDNVKSRKNFEVIIKRSTIFILGSSILVSTFLWAFAFSRIYTKPHTRVEATRWLFQNVPGPINLSIQLGDNFYNQPIAFASGATVDPGFSQEVRFTAKEAGILSEIYLPHILDRATINDFALNVVLASVVEGKILLDETISEGEILAGNGDAFSYRFIEPAIIREGEPYTLEFYVENPNNDFAICDPLILDLQTTLGQTQIELPVQPTCLFDKDLPSPFIIEVEEDSILQQVTMQVQFEPQEEGIEDKTLSVEIQDSTGRTLGTGAITSEFLPLMDPRGDAYRFLFPEMVQIEKEDSYTLIFSLISGNGNISFSGTSMANESSWDDGLPLRMDGYDPYGGLYQGGLNFEMYWDDNQEKYDRFVNILDHADIILITSSRQWGTTTRVPERYPLTTEYYHSLVGCPPDQTIEWCYNVAQPGTFQGDLGFELVQVFQSNPSIAGFDINDQFSEEAFTVYDHPKVFVFQKTGEYDPRKVRDILGAVDLTKVIRVTPKQADSHPGDLQLPQERLEEQRLGGTWSRYLNFDGLQNRVQIIAILYWYGCVGLLGLLVYPLVWFSLPGLADHGYPLTRVAGFLLLSGLVWLAGSARIPFNRTTISFVLLGILSLNAVLAFHQRKALSQEVNSRWKYFLKIEGLFLLFFVIGLLIKFGNPDLWHPWKGGEKPMDFSYFNAVLKSTSFPPYDPWYAGGYINYYYYGFVLVGVLVKYLGILPSIAYNLILATLFSMIVLGAFSVVWNLVSNIGGDFKKADDEAIPLSQENLEGNTHPASLSRKATGREQLKEKLSNPHRFIVSLAGALAMGVLGNLGILQMFFRGLQMNVVSVEEIDSAGIISKICWTVSGFIKTISGSTIPIRMDEWYWNPSRVISYEHGNPITEFPFFTFLYGDLHAHLIALPVALLAIAWVVAVVKGKVWQKPGGRSWPQIVSGFLLGGLAVGALYPINLSDIYTYLPLSLLAFGYATWRYLDDKDKASISIRKKMSSRRLLWIILGMVALYALSQLIYKPYSYWYGQGYSKIQLWTGTHTPLVQYLTHWGALLFVIVSWMFYESIDWMATTPVSALRKLAPYRNLIWTGFSFMVVLILVLGVSLHPGGLSEGDLPIGLGVHIAWLVIPLACWAGVLLLRPGFSDGKRLVLFFIGTGLMLTLMVEIVVVSGDIGRMNTVFKFYLQAWTLFSVSCGAALGWLIKGMSKWSLKWRTLFQLLLGAFIFSTALYPLLGTIAKVSDRMEPTTPHTLDGMTYMQYATYHDEGVAMDLSQDYNAIRWMQDNIQGSPVIVEANSVEYHWGTRYTIYTGLPGVIGWNWHQRQQRTINPHDWVIERVDDVHEFYQTEDLQWTEDFLHKYDVRYVVFGQLEQAKYQGPGLLKFEAMEDVLWREVFRDRDTIIYEVLR